MTLLMCHSMELIHSRSPNSQPIIINLLRLLHLPRNPQSTSVISQVHRLAFATMAILTHPTNQSTIHPSTNRNKRTFTAQASHRTHHAWLLSKTRGRGRPHYTISSSGSHHLCFTFGFHFTAPFQTSTLHFVYFFLM